MLSFSTAPWRYLQGEKHARGARIAPADTGEGLFIAALDRQLRRRGSDVPAFEHDLGE
jgi:hypothetical protein